MNQAIRFLKLDYITIKPYLTWKLALLSLGVLVVMMLTTDVGMGGIFFMFGYGALFVSYPFSVGEQNGIDALYPVLSIQRKSVVLGRYLFALTIDLSVGIIALFMMALFALVQGKASEWGETFAVFAVAFAFFSLLQTVQLPLFFRLGYARAKVMSILPFLSIPALVFLYQFLSELEAPARAFASIGVWIRDNGPLAIAFAAALWVLAVFASYRIARRVYEKRDF